MDLTPYIGKRFTLWLTDDHNESAVFGGWSASLSNETLLLQREGGELELEKQWLERIRPVPDGESKEILLNADYFLLLTVGPVSEFFTNYAKTGMRWPQ